MSPANLTGQLFESYCTCQLLMPSFRVTSPANFSCQRFKNYFTCRLLMPTFRVSSPANFSSSDGNCYAIHHLHKKRLQTSPASFSCQLFKSYFTCQLLMPTFRELLHLPTSHANVLRITLPTNFSCHLFEGLLILHLPASHANFRELLHLPTSIFSRGTSLANFSCQLFEIYFTCFMRVSSPASTCLYASGPLVVCVFSYFLSNWYLSIFLQSLPSPMLYIAHYPEQN